MAKKTSRKTARPAAPRKKSAGKKCASKASTNVLVVNMIPRALSGESHQDSEPTIAVNPANPLHIAGSAFTPDPGGGSLAPIFVSVDGGNTWTLKSIVPSSASDGSATADITLAFGTASNKLYAGIIRLPFPPGRPRLNILRTDNFQSGATMKVLVDRTGKGIDQPYVQAATVLNGPDQGKDRVYVGDNDFGNTPRSATIDQSLNAGKTSPTFTSVRIESRSPAGQDGPPVRPAIHPDGTVYAVFHSWLTFDSNDEGTADIVVVRDDNGADYMLHVLRSTNRGVTWSGDLRTVRNALNPAVAINSAGKVGLLYQQLTGSGPTQRWVTKFESSTNGTTWSAMTLATVPANTPPKQFDPYLGDYEHLMSVGKDFYGVFCANNTPNKSNFPKGVTYQRNANFTSHTLLDVDNATPVDVSIDPFFFKVP